MICTLQSENEWSLELKWLYKKVIKLFLCEVYVDWTYFLLFERSGPHTELCICTRYQILSCTRFCILIHVQKILYLFFFQFKFFGQLYNFGIQYFKCLRKNRQWQLSSTFTKKSVLKANPEPGSITFLTAAYLSITLERKKCKTHLHLICHIQLKYTCNGHHLVKVVKQTIKCFIYWQRTMDSDALPQIIILFHWYSPDCPLSNQGSLISAIASECLVQKSCHFHFIFSILSYFAWKIIYNIL